MDFALEFPRDDARHGHGSHPRWNESLFFTFFDRHQQLGGIARIGFLPGEGRVEAGLGLYMGSSILSVFATDVWTPPRLGEHDVSVGGLRFLCEQPASRWVVEYTGEGRYVDHPPDSIHIGAAGMDGQPRRQLSLRVTFQAFHPPFLFPSLPQRWLPLRQALRGPGGGGTLRERIRLLPERVSSAVAMRDGRHFEQGGHVSGDLCVDGEAYQIVGTGTRDRSWGVRDWRVATRHRWVTAHFGEQLGFTAFRMHLFGYDAWGGYVWNGGRLAPLDDWSIEPHADHSAMLTLKPRGGPTHAVGVDNRVHMPVLLREPGFTAVINDRLARFSWNGLQTHGINEKEERRYP